MEVQSVVIVKAGGFLPANDWGSSGFKATCREGSHRSLVYTTHILIIQSWSKIWQWPKIPRQGLCARTLSVFVPLKCHWGTERKAWSPYWFKEYRSAADLRPPCVGRQMTRAFPTGTKNNNILNIHELINCVAGDWRNPRPCGNISYSREESVTILSPWAIWTILGMELF